MVLGVRKARPTIIQQHHGNGRRRGLFRRGPHWSVTQWRIHTMYAGTHAPH